MLASTNYSYIKGKAADKNILIKGFPNIRCWICFEIGASSLLQLRDGINLLHAEERVVDN